MHIVGRQLNKQGSICCLTLGITSKLEPDDITCLCWMEHIRSLLLVGKLAPTFRQSMHVGAGIILEY